MKYSSQLIVVFLNAKIYIAFQPTSRPSILSINVQKVFPLNRLNIFTCVTRRGGSRLMLQMQMHPSESHISEIVSKINKIMPL